MGMSADYANAVQLYYNNLFINVALDESWEYQYSRRKYHFWGKIVVNKQLNCKILILS